MTATIPGSVNPVVTTQGVRFGNSLKLALIAGPCALESRDHAFDMAGALEELTRKLDIGFVFKSSFDKANRTSLTAQRGLGLDKALAIFADIREKLGVVLHAGLAHWSRIHQLFSPMCMSLPNAPRSPRPSTFCKSRLSSAGRRIFSSPPPRPAVSSMSRKGNSSRPGT